MTISNAARAQRAENALQFYIASKGEEFENSRSEITDLIADLLHLVNRDHNPDDETPWIDDAIQATLDLAQMHFDAERDDAEEDDSGATQDECICDVAASSGKAMPLPKLIYMPEESTPTIATVGNKEAIAYIEFGEYMHQYGRLFAKAPEILDKFLDVKRLAESGNDSGYDPYSLLETIGYEVRTALSMMT